MIKSLTFTGEFGYITEKIAEPTCPVRGYCDEHTPSWRKLSEKEQERIKKWKKDHKEWKKHKDDYANPHLVKNLLNRKFEFEEGKINIIFGPNASGKTTILRAIAGNAGCDDGYPTLMSPLDVRDFGEKATIERFKERLVKKMRNSADIDWDGVPVYYDNFANRTNRGSLGDLSGSVLGDDLITEVHYIMGKDKISLGQNSIYLINRLFNIAQSHLSFKDIFKEYINEDGTRKDLEIRMNDVWSDAYNIQLDYYMGFSNSCENLPGTFLFDELDKSLDILNIYNLYVNVLPDFVRKTGVQVIIISHSPLVLMDKIRNNEMYNFISIDEDYTNVCIEKLGELF